MRNNSEELSIIRRSQNFACKTARWVRVTFFLKENFFIALVIHKISYTSSLHISIEISMKL
jgi:hypothetical protein